MQKVVFTINKAMCQRCDVCVDYCPRKVFARDFEGYPLVRQPESCVACGVCEMLCTDRALTMDIVEAEEAGPWVEEMAV